MCTHWPVVRVQGRSNLSHILFDDDRLNWIGTSHHSTLGASRIVSTSVHALFIYACGRRRDVFFPSIHEF